MSKEQINAVFNLVTSNRFARWYQSDFMDYFCADEGAPSKEQLLQWLADQLPSNDEDELSEPDHNKLWYDTSAELL